MMLVNRLGGGRVDIGGIATRDVMWGWGGRWYGVVRVEFIGSGEGLCEPRPLRPVLMRRIAYTRAKEGLGNVRELWTWHRDKRESESSPAGG